MRTLLFLSLSLMLAACAGPQLLTNTVTKTDTVITVQAKVIHDTTSLSPIYYGGQNTGCDTAAILAAASFTIAKQNAQGGVSLYKYNALKRKFQSLNSIPPQKIYVPGINTTRLQVQKLSLWDYIKIGCVAIVLFIGLMLIGKSVLPAISGLFTKLPLGL